MPSTVCSTATSTNGCGVPVAVRCPGTPSVRWARPLFGVILGIAATLWLGYFVNWLSAALALGANAFYIAVYTLWLKRRTPQNIIWGGIAGCFPPLIGWTAVTGSLALHSVRHVLDRVLLDAAAHLGARHPLSGGLRRGERADAACREVSPGGGPADHGVLGGDGLGVVDPLAGGAHRLAVSSRRRRSSALRCSGNPHCCWRARRGLTDAALQPMRLFHWSNSYLALLFVAAAVDTLPAEARCSLTKRVDHETSQRRHRGKRRVAPYGTRHERADCWSPRLPGIVERPF